MADKNYIYDTFIKKTEILSKALEKATERTRSMLYVVTFFSLIIIISVFNAYISWDRKVNADERLLLAEEMSIIPASVFKPFNHKLVDWLKENPEDIKKINLSEIDKNTAKIISQLQQEAEDNPRIRLKLDNYIKNLNDLHLLVNPTDFFKLYFDRQKFTLPILGISCYADDIYLIGGLGLLVLLTYCFFSVRRENRVVQRIVKSIEYIDKKEPKFYLDNVDVSPEELLLIKHNLLEYIFYGCVEFFIFNIGLTTPDITVEVENKLGKKSITNTSGRLVLSWLYYLPIVAILFSLIFEIKSVIDRHNFMSRLDFYELGAKYFLTLIFLIIIILQCKWIRDLNKDNSELIEKMHNIIIGSRKSLNLD